MALTAPFLTALGFDPITVFASQNAAGSLGNLICPNNVVSACMTVTAIGRGQCH